MVKTKVQPLTEDEVKSILNAAMANKRDYLILRLLAKTGMRIGELHRINEQDIDFKRKVIFIPIAKRDERREVIFDDMTGTLLYYWISEGKKNGIIKPGGPIWGKLTYRAIQYIPPRYAEKAGVTKIVSCHSFRHFFATFCFKNGLSEFTTQKLLGHKSLTTTKLYTMVVTEDVAADYNKIMSAW